MAQGPGTRCAGCGRFIATRTQHGDYQAEERAYHVDQAEEHVCSLDWEPEAAWSPRAGEHDAYLASIELEQIELGDTFEVQPFELQPATAAISVNPSPAWMEATEHEARLLPVVPRLHAVSAQPRRPTNPNRSVRPAEYASRGEQLNLTGGHRGPVGPERRRVVPNPWPTHTTATVRSARVRPAASPHGPAQPIPLASMAGNSDRDTPTDRGGIDHDHPRTAPRHPRTAPPQSRAAAPGLPRRHRGPQPSRSRGQAGWDASTRGLPASRGHTIHVQPARQQVECDGIPAAVGRWFRQRDKRPDLQRLARTGPFGT